MNRYNTDEGHDYIEVLTAYVLGRNHNPVFARGYIEVTSREEY